MLATWMLALLLGSVAQERIGVDAERRNLVRADGTPFFWLGDTAWELFHRLSREDAELYLRQRAALGFTVIQAVALAELDGLRTPNAYGHLPLCDLDPARPDVKEGPGNDYWDHVDWVIARANALGLQVGLLPTWGDKWNRKWGQGPEVFTPENAAAYGTWIGRRYREAGVIWILGGDRPVENERHRAILDSMAGAIRAASPGRLLTFHPVGGRGSSEWFHDAAWLDLNLRQNGHGPDHGSYAKTRLDFDRVPPKPVIDGEPIYEDHPVAFKAKEFGYSTAAHVRRALYWDLFGGACGHTYGHHSVWSFHQEGREPVNHPLMTWREALGQPGAAQMRHGRALLESRPMGSRIPDDSIIVPQGTGTAVPGAGWLRMAATRDREGTYAFVYAPSGRAFEVRLDAIQGKGVRAWWFDPRTGASRAAGEFEGGRGVRSFLPPTPGETLDWILVLDDASRNYGPPGMGK